jgi:hypothetical protein
MKYASNVKFIWFRFGSLALTSRSIRVMLGTHTGLNIYKIAPTQDRRLSNGNPPNVCHCHTFALRLRHRPGMQPLVDKYWQ